MPITKNKVTTKIKMFPLVEPTKTELAGIARGRKEIQAGKYVEWSKLKNELAHSRRRNRRQTN